MNCSIDNYHVLPVPILCETGIWANPVNGHRLQRDEWTNTCTEYNGDRYSHKVNKRTLRPIYAAAWRINLSGMIFSVFTGGRVNKHGVNWSPVYSAKFDFYTPKITEEGEHNFLYWIRDEGSVGLYRNLLKGKVMPENAMPLCITLAWGDEMQDLLPSDISMDEFAILWYRGDLERLLQENQGLRKYRFGVEIEFTGITRFQAAKVISRHFGVLVHKNKSLFGTNYYVTDSDGGNWHIIRDGSIRTERKDGEDANDNYRCELVTPILSYKQIDLLQMLLRKLRKRGMIVNDSCGIHVHVNVKDFSVWSLRNLVNIMSARETLLFKALEVNHNREMQYCKRISPIFVRSLQTIVPLSEEKMKALWYEHCGINPHSSRYHALNLHSLWMGKGVEFRMFNSTTHAGKLKTYIQLSLAICEQARTRSCASPHARHASSEKAQFRSWIAMLGMTGDEFATARKHLLANLKIENVA